MALWNKDVYKPEEPIPEPDPIGFDYSKQLRTDVNFPPSFRGFHFDGAIRQRGTGVTPKGSGADRFGVEDDGKKCRFWYDNLEMSAGSVGRMIVDAGCDWQILSPDQEDTNKTGRSSSTFRQISIRNGVVDIAAPKRVPALGVVVFEVQAIAEGETVVVLRAKEPEWFLEEAREQRRQEIKLEKAARKKAAVRRAKQEEARRLIYGDNPPPLEDVKDANGNPEVPPLWGKSLPDDLAASYEGVFAVELHFVCKPATSSKPAQKLLPMEVYSLTALSSESESDDETPGAGSAIASGNGSSSAAVLL